MMCKFKTSWNDNDLKIDNLEFHLRLLKDLEIDGLVNIYKDSLTIPEHARPFVRNICMAFDKKLHQKQPQEKLFSQTI
jgi:oxygen-independent coproporphyrinogen-3 oxidase